VALDGAVSAARCAGFFDMARLFSVTVFSDIRNKSIPAQSPVLAEKADKLVNGRP
jgi:hypothetical protein